MNIFINFFWKERLKVLLWHLLFSFMLLLIALFLIYFIWYPQPLVIAMGVMKIYIIILSIDLILGPILTAIVYKKNRKLFLMNVSIIVLLQLSAYFYGLYIVEKGRPAFQVFVVDDIELVSPSSIDLQKLPSNINYHFFSKPQWIGAPFSDDPVLGKQQRQDELVKGLSMAYRTEYYNSLFEYQNKVLNKLHPLDELNQYNQQEYVKKQISKYSNAIGWLPVKASEVDMVALFDKNGQAVAIIDLRPW